MELKLLSDRPPREGRAHYLFPDPEVKPEGHVPPEVVVVSNEPDPTRECGDCSVCCSYYAIPEIGVQMGVTCPLLSKCGSSCLIHGEEYTPPLCKTYFCLWRLGNFGDDERPDHVPREALQIMLGVRQLDRYVDDHPEAREWSADEIVRAFKAKRGL